MSKNRSLKFYAEIIRCGFSLVQRVNREILRVEDGDREIWVSRSVFDRADGIYLERRVYI